MLGALAGCAGQRVSLSGLDALPPEAPVLELADVPFFPQEELQCGPAALATVLGAAGTTTAPEILAGEVFTPGLGGSLQLELAAAARSRGFVPYVPAPALDDLLAELVAGRPVLVLQNLRVKSWPAWHYAVLVGADATTDTLVLRSGTQRRLEMDAGEFLRTWDWAGRWALVLLRPGELPARPDRHRYAEAVLGLEESGRHPAAARAWAAALAEWPDDSLALFGLATNSYLAGDLPSARSAYERLLALEPAHSAALNNLANVLADEGCPASAARLAQQAIDAAAGDPELTRAAADTLAGLPSAPDGPACTGPARAD